MIWRLLFGHRSNIESAKHDIETMAFIARHLGQANISALYTLGQEIEKLRDENFQLRLRNEELERELREMMV